MSADECPPVFISYSSRDRTKADRVREALERAGIRAWVAHQDLSGGPKWNVSIPEALDHTRVVVLVLSKAANESPEVAREMDLALVENIPVIPYCIEDVVPSKQIKYLLSTAHRIAAWEPPTEAHLPTLVEAVRSQLEGAPVGGPRRLALRPLLRRALIMNAVVFGAFLFAVQLGPFGVEASTAAYSRDLVNFVFAPLYPTEARERMGVVLIKDSTLRAYGLDWPVRYEFHAAVLRVLRKIGVRAVMMDLLFIDERADFPIDRFLAELDQYAKERIPVYAASDRTEPIRADVRERVIPVPVPALVREGDRPGRAYPLIGDGFGSIARPTAALQMYLDLNGEPDSLADLRATYGQPMRIFWGTLVPEINREVYQCTPPPGSVAEAVFSRAFGSAGRGLSDCFYTPTKFAHDLLTHAGSPAVQNMVRDNVVFYGADLAGRGDQVYPPTHTRLPGVYLHAMALDNLLTFESRYLRESDGRLAWIGRLIALAVVLVAIVELAFWRAWQGHQGNRRSGGLELAHGAALLAGCLALAGAGSLWAARAWGLAPVNWLAILIVLGAGSLTEFRLAGRR